MLRPHDARLLRLLLRLLCMALPTWRSLLLLLDMLQWLGRLWRWHIVMVRRRSHRRRGGLHILGWRCRGLHILLLRHCH